MTWKVRPASNWIMTRCHWMNATFAVISCLRHSRTGRGGGCAGGGGGGVTGSGGSSTSKALAGAPWQLGSGFQQVSAIDLLAGSVSSGQAAQYRVIHCYSYTWQACSATDVVLGASTKHAIGHCLDALWHETALLCKLPLAVTQRLSYYHGITTM
jgi:hypothetical protein